MFLGGFDAFFFKLYLKVNIHPFHVFLLVTYCLKMSSKIGNISESTKELEIFTNWTTDGTQYTFHENWL